MSFLKKPPVKAVFFDCDGTLINTIPLVVSSKQHAFAKMGRVAPPEDELIATIGLPLGQDIADYFKEDEVPQYMEYYRAFQRDREQSQLAVFSEAYHTVVELWKRGIPMGVVTSRLRPSTMRLLELFHMKQFFTVMVNAGDTARSKPYGDPLLEGIRRLNETGMLLDELRPEECVYVGDAHHDIGTAQGAGARAVLVEWTNMPSSVLEGLEYEATLHTHEQFLNDLGLL